MALFLLENRDFLIELNLYLIVHSIEVEFEKIWLSGILNIKVPLNQILSNSNRKVGTIKYRLSSITVYFTFTVPQLWPFFS
jgi:hypothetical protein